MPERRAPACCVYCRRIFAFYPGEYVFCPNDSCIREHGRRHGKHISSIPAERRTSDVLMMAELQGDTYSENIKTGARSISRVARGVVWRYVTQYRSGATVWETDDPRIPEHGRRYIVDSHGSLDCAA